MAPLMTAREVSELLGVATSWVYTEARASRMPHLRLGRYVRFRRESIEAWAQSLERGAGPMRM
jgi:excisionase family DNA binding protein